MRHFFLMLLLLQVTTSFANESEDSLTWIYDEASSTLTISGTGAMPDYSYAEAPWWDNRNEIKTVVIEEGLTTIGINAFAFCAFDSVSIPRSVTAIGENAFYLCPALCSVVIPDEVTTIGEYAFSFCSGLLSVKFSENLTRINSLSFFGCSSLTSVVIPNSVESIGSQSFAGCLNLSEITFPDNLQSISGDAFYNTAWYKALPDDYFVYVKNILWFYKDERLGVEKENIDLKVADGTVSIMSGLLYSNQRLISLTLPADLRLIENMAFASCTKLASITIHAEMPPRIESATFNDVIKSIPVYVPAASLEAYRNAEYWKAFTNIQVINTNISEISPARKVYAQGNRIVTEGTDNATISVHDLFGRAIKFDNPAYITVPCPGVYLIKVNNETVKILIK